MELAVSAGCERPECAQGPLVVDPAMGCTAVPLLTVVVVVDSTAGLDGRTADPGRIHTVAKNVGVVGRFEKMTLEEVESVVQLVDRLAGQLVLR